MIKQINKNVAMILTKTKEQINKTRIKHEIRKEFFATLYFSSSCPVQGTVQKGIISSDYFLTEKII